MIRNVRVHWAPMLDPFGLPAKYDQELTIQCNQRVAGVLIEPQEIWPAYFSFPLPTHSLSSGCGAHREATSIIHKWRIFHAVFDFWKVAVIFLDQPGPSEISRSVPSVGAWQAFQNATRYPPVSRHNHYLQMIPKENQGFPQHFVK